MGTAFTGDVASLFGAGDARMSDFRTSGDRIVGARLRLRRKQCAISERELAAFLSVGEREIQAYESGEARIGAERLALAGEALGAPISFFFSGFSPVDVSKADAAPCPEKLSPGAADLLSAYSRIANSQLRAAVLRLALHLARGRQAAVSLALAEAHARKRRSN
jgi:transcriptional regulator with XRE-family HTH domain